MTRGRRAQAIPGITSYSLDGCRRVYATSLFSGVVKRLTTTGECVPPPDACTITGTEEDDRLEGTAGADVICGLGGRDRLIGLGGNDVLAGGDGDDTLEGDGGDDLFRGGDGADIADYAGQATPVNVTLGSGADDGVAGEADDVGADVERVRGGSGNDRLTAAAASRSRLIGLGGADVLAGGSADDTLEGGAGADELDGHGGHDTLLAGDNDDRLLARDGTHDRLVCGAGADFSDPDPVDVVDASCE